MNKRIGDVHSAKGITLIALVVTIIILIILAGTTIGLLTREDGILNVVIKAREKHNEESIHDKITLAVLSSIINKNNSGEIDTEVLQNQLDKLKNGKEIDSYSPSETFDLPAIVEKDGYMFSIDRSGNVKRIEKNENLNWKEPSGYDKDPTLWYNYGGATVNEPKLIGSMKAVAYTGSLAGETNLWANAMTADGSMWVWIPRFAYKITSGYVEKKVHDSDNANVNGVIEIKFLSVDNEFLDGTNEKLVTDPSEITYSSGKQNEWLVHPAFTAKPENGGWDTELSGFWMGKFEATGTYDTTNDQGILSVKPACQSLRNLTINQAYKLAKSSTFGESVTADELGSHMAKNSEWGAVAYLTHSQYGTNREKVGKNPSQLFYTGGSDSENTIYQSNSNQSTTGNATGVYDMNGGAWEYVACYVNWRNGTTSSWYKNSFNNDDSKDLLIINGGGKSTDLYGNSGDLRNTSTKYKTVYTSARFKGI